MPLVWTYDSVPENAAQTAERAPCPFCHDDCTGLSHVNGNKVVICLNCHAVGPALIPPYKSGNWNEDDFRAILLWNGRDGWHNDELKHGANNQ